MRDPEPPSCQPGILRASSSRPRRIRHNNLTNASTTLCRRGTTFRARSGGRDRPAGRDLEIVLRGEIARRRETVLHYENLRRLGVRLHGIDHEGHPRRPHRHVHPSPRAACTEWRSERTQMKGDASSLEASPCVLPIMCFRVFLSSELISRGLPHSSLPVPNRAPGGEPNRIVRSGFFGRISRLALRRYHTRFSPQDLKQFFPRSD